MVCNFFYLIVAHEYDIPLDVETIQKKIRSEFDKNRHVTDIRVIDMLVVKVRL